MDEQLDRVEYSPNAVPDSINISDSAGRYLEMLKARFSAREYLTAWLDLQAMQKKLQKLVAGSNL